MLQVQFRYLTGLKRRLFHGARLIGCWNPGGGPASAACEWPMAEYTADDGCPAFTLTLPFDDAQIGQDYIWTVRLCTTTVADICGVATEVDHPERRERALSFRLRPAAGDGPQVVEHDFTAARRYGAQKVYASMQGGADAAPSLRFTVWAPHAQQVDVVFGDATHGYVADDGTGIDPARAALPMVRGDGGIWQSAVVPDFAAHVGLPYMYRVVNEQGRTVYRTDLFSRQQSGHGTVDPRGAPWFGGTVALDGTKSCSVVVDLDVIAREFLPALDAPLALQSDDEFWNSEFTPGLPVPSRVSDLVIYELHIGALGHGKPTPGTIEDAIALLPYLSDLGVNAIELLPMSEFSGIGWGYGDSHHFVIESTAGNRDQYKHFVRACHRRGIAVIQDVVYNHFDGNAARAQWQYDSEDPEHNIWYWYEGSRAHYASEDGGYLDNGSSGYAPRYHEEVVRQFFIASAAAFIEEFHVDGLRVDLTQALHRDNTLHDENNRRPIANANLYGAKLLREWSRTLRLIKPSVMLIAEDHTGWDKVTQLPDVGGLGFDATWDAAFYHHLIGDADAANSHARLLKNAGYGDDRALDFGRFAAVLYESRLDRVVYHESHDEAGNAGGSTRTLPCAVNGAPLAGATRAWAEARARWVFGIALLSPGTPMFFMGEEIGAAQPYRYDSFMLHREDLIGDRAGRGAQLFRYYQDAIRLARRHRAVRVQSIDIVHVDDGARVIAFRRSAGRDELLVIASLANRPYDDYTIRTEPHRLPDGHWQEIFNSDAALYGGHNVGNDGAALTAAAGVLRARLPAVGLLVFAKL